MRTLFRKKEQGVVLLSCLIFLLLMLTLLRYVLSSSQMGEFKAGADYDQLTAKETAMLVMRDAELDILRTAADGRTSLINGVGSSERERLHAAVSYWLDKNKWSSRSGVFDGDARTLCVGNTTPLYLCNAINWSPSADCGASSNTVCYGEEQKRYANVDAVMRSVAVDANGAVTGLQDESAQNSRKRGRYIIERFAGSGGTLNFDKGSDANVIILRVTAIGFSQPSADNAVSHAVLQNTYILAKEGE